MTFRDLLVTVSFDCNPLVTIVSDSDDSISYGHYNPLRAAALRGEWFACFDYNVSCVFENVQGPYNVVTIVCKVC